jgi:lysozyme
MTIHTQHRHGHHAVHTVHHPAPAVTPKYIRGIDVSHHNEGGSKHHPVHIDWNAVKADGVRFAFAKSTEGISGVDNSFVVNWPRMKAAGLIRGAFHFGRPDLQKPKEQAQFFHRTVNPEKGDLPLVLDFERRKDTVPYNLTKVQLWDWAKDFLAEIQRLTGRPGIIYSGPFIRDDVGNPTDNLNCPLWLPAVVHDPKPWVPRAWRTPATSNDPGWTFWQWAEMKATPGTPHGAEQDYFKGTIDELQKLTYTTTPSGS